MVNKKEKSSSFGGSYNKMKAKNVSAKNKRIIMWVAIGVMVGLISYGAWLGVGI